MEKSDEPRRNIRNSSLRSLISLGCLEDSFRFFSLLPSSMDSPAIKGNKKKKKNEKKGAGSVRVQIPTRAGRRGYTPCLELGPAVGW